MLLPCTAAMLVLWPWRCCGSIPRRWLRLYLGGLSPWSLCHNPRGCCSSGVPVPTPQGSLGEGSCLKEQVEITPDTRRATTQMPFHHREHLPVLAVSSSGGSAAVPCHPHCGTPLLGQSGVPSPLQTASAAPLGGLGRLLDQEEMPLSREG